MLLKVLRGSRRVLGTEWGWVSLGLSDDTMDSGVAQALGAFYLPLPSPRFSGRCSVRTTARQGG